MAHHKSVIAGIGQTRTASDEGADVVLSSDTFVIVRKMKPELEC